MRIVTTAFRWTRMKVSRLQALIAGKDHDSWYDDHAGDYEKPPNVSGNMWANGGGGGGVGGG
ncbi:hypothetical protein [Pedococcus sp. 2YAF34]|uniref:hypothetical protein n=1 Tax=Pedococcus sp. 2YAF34 TaxID=3233032 RepID=UPI003F9A1FC9